jgi:hypothetical protein
VRTTFQVLPFQTSASVDRTPLAIVWPTAMQDALWQDTAPRAAPGPAGAGGAAVHVVPFQAMMPCMNVSVMQLVELPHEIALVQPHG